LHSLLIILRARDQWLLHRAAAYCLFLGACLADEVALALAPLPILAIVLGLQTGVGRAEVWWRTLPYTVTVAALLPLQFMFTRNDEPRLIKYHLSWDIVEQSWALLAQLVLPLARSNPMDVPFTGISQLQWSAGAVAAVLGVLLFVTGSTLMRFLLLWILLALAPFALWDYDFVAPRYVYLAAAPFSVLTMVIAASIVERMRRSGTRRAATTAIVAAVSVMVALGAIGTIQRNREFERAIRPFELLGVGMKRAVPRIPPGARVVIYFGIWDHFSVWPAVVLQTVYRDPTLRVINVRPRDVRHTRPGPDDFPVYYVGGQFWRTPPVQ
jgi:hypothetical protein